MLGAPFDEIIAPTAKELFVRRIEGAILSGGLSIGELLPTTRQLAEQMKISCSVVNSGIKDMIRKGFLEVVPHKGIFVADYAMNGNLETMASIMNYNGDRINKQVYLSILEVRRALEVPAVQKVAQCRNDQQLTDLKRIVEELRQCTDCQQASRILFKFHHTIGLISGNVIYPLIFKSFSPAIMVLWERYCDHRGLPQTCRTLDELLGHIENRAPNQAGELIYKTITEVLDCTAMQNPKASTDRPQVRPA